MDSTTFCGQTCHTVMQPEFSAYQNSPHARVECVQCHIGPGAGWFVRSKLSGLAPGLCRDIQNLFPAHSVSREVPATRAGNVRAVPLAAAFLRRQVHREDQLQGRRKEHADDHRAADEDRRTYLARRRSAIHGRHLDAGSRIRYISTDDAAAGHSGGVLHGRQRQDRRIRVDGHQGQQGTIGKGRAPHDGLHRLPQPPDARL